MKENRGVIDIKESQRLVEMFEENLETNTTDVKREVTSKGENMEKKVFKVIDSFALEENNNKPQFPVPKSRLTNAGLGKAVFEFFDKKQRQSKTIGFKDLIEKNLNGSSKIHNFRKKSAKPPGYDLQVKKLLEQNKRLHSQL